MAGMAQALLYLLYVDGSNRTACICYDSEWAANTIQGKWKAREKDIKPIVGWAQRLLAKARESREVRFAHVRGRCQLRWIRDAQTDCPAHELGVTESLRAGRSGGCAEDGCRVTGMGGTAVCSFLST